VLKKDRGGGGADCVLLVWREGEGGIRLLSDETNFDVSEGGKAERFSKKKRAQGERSNWGFTRRGKKD